MLINKAEDYNFLSRPGTHKTPENPYPATTKVVNNNRAGDDFIENLT